MILTTGQGFRNGGKAPEFNSLSYHGLVRDGEWGVKIFSKQRISDEWLEKVFPGTVGWVFRKEVGSRWPSFVHTLLTRTVSAVGSLSETSSYSVVSPSQTCPRFLLCQLL